MKIFIIHYKKLIERKISIIEQLSKQGLTDYMFIDISRDELTEQDMSIFQENYSKAQIAITLSHFSVYKQIRDNYESGLILEDDVILSDNFMNIYKIHRTIT